MRGGLWGIQDCDAWDFQLIFFFLVGFRLNDVLGVRDQPSGSMSNLRMYRIIRMVD
jgi:hypothetical protein